MPTTRIDRLSALVSRFALDVMPETRELANLAIYACDSSSLPIRVVFLPDSTLAQDDDGQPEPAFCALAQWGGSDNPLVSALPDRIELEISGDAEMQSLAALLIAENLAKRCGAGSVINRLCEVLLVRLLRAQVGMGSTDVGLLGGLADDRLSRAIVAMHEHPGRVWRIDQLAEIAGLSVSRFAGRFTSTVGQTPMAYLRHWRMVLARQDVEQGDRIQVVASRYGYASSEAMTRAFKRQYGSSPTALRR